MEGYLAQIIMFAGTFAPRNWAYCDGTILPISQYTALFSLIGTTYGGDGRTTFALPDLRGRAAIHAGHGPGLSNRVLGQKGGEEAVALTVPQLASHTHQAYCQSAAGNTNSPIGNIWSTDAGTTSATYSSVSHNENMAANAIGPAGNGQPHDNMSPFLVVNYVICIQGIYPSRP